MEGIDARRERLSYGYYPFTGGLALPGCQHVGPVSVNQTHANTQHRQPSLQSRIKTRLGVQGRHERWHIKRDFGWRAASGIVQYRANQRYAAILQALDQLAGLLQQRNVFARHSQCSTGTGGNQLSVGKGTASWRVNQDHVK